MSACGWQKSPKSSHIQIVCVCVRAYTCVCVFWWNKKEEKRKQQTENKTPRDSSQAMQQSAEDSSSLMDTDHGSNVLSASSPPLNSAVAVPSSVAIAAAAGSVPVPAGVGSAPGVGRTGESLEFHCRMLEGTPTTSHKSLTKLTQYRLYSVLRRVRRASHVKRTRQNAPAFLWGGFRLSVLPSCKQEKKKRAEQIIDFTTVEENFALVGTYL